MYENYPTQILGPPGSHSNNLYLNIIYRYEKGLYTHHFKIHPGLLQVLNSADRKISLGNGPALISLHSDFTHPQVLHSLTCTGFYKTS